MAIEIRRDFAASSEAVLAAIRRSAEWRESAIPADLKKEAVIGIDVKVSGSAFRLGYVRKWYPGESDLLELRGLVQSLPDGTSHLIGRCGYNRGLMGFLIILGMLALLSALSGGAGILALAAIALVVILGTVFMNTHAERGMDKEATYLVERLDQVLQPLAKNPRVRAPAI